MVTERLGFRKCEYLSVNHCSSTHLGRELPRLWVSLQAITPTCRPTHLTHQGSGWHMNGHYSLQNNNDASDTSPASLDSIYSRREMLNCSRCSSTSGCHGCSG